MTSLGPKIIREFELQWGNYSSRRKGRTQSAGPREPMASAWSHVQ